MSECIDLPELNLPDFPLGLSVPQLPKISFGEVNACCIVLVPQINISIPIDLPSSIEIPLAAVTELKLKLMEEYFKLKDMLPECPFE